MTTRGQYINLDKYSLRLPSIQRISELRSQNIHTVPLEESTSQATSIFDDPRSLGVPMDGNDASSRRNKALQQGVTCTSSVLYHPLFSCIYLLYIEQFWTSWIWEMVMQ